MRLAAIVGFCLILPAAVLAGDGPPDRTCDSCIDIDGSIVPTPAWQVVSGSTVGQPNSEYTYEFCAVGGGTYTFSTCDGTSPGGADYDTALSIWTEAGGLCAAQEACNDDNCVGGSSGLRSEIAWVAPANGNYLIVVDGFSTREGNYDLAYMGPTCQTTPVEDGTWGTIKAVYR
jgi:hypothetical protein